VKASVIIPTRNRADLLGRCLESLTQQTLAPESFEVLVIDNGSKDHTASVAKKYADALQITYACVPEPGLHNGRHAGLRRAKADVLIFTDDDVEAEPTWVEAVLETFQDPDIALVGGNNYPNFEVDPPAWLLHWWQQPKGKGHALNSLSILDFGAGVFKIDPGYVWGCNFSIRRDVLLKARGFHPDGYPIERIRFRGDGETHVSDVVRSSDLRSVFNSRASVRHLVSGNRMTRAYIEQRAYAQGISDSYTIIRHNGGLATPLPLKVRRKLRCIRIELTNLIHSVMSMADSVKRELCAVQRSALLAYRKGYEFHREAVSKNSALLDWVLKQDYLE
jgi:glucosyl-dolichyl phosphate glucuronosyltransferase